MALCIACAKIAVHLFSEVVVADPVELKRSTLLRHTARIVSAHASRHNLGAEALSALIHDIFNVLRDLNASQPTAVEKRQPAVLVKKSVFPEYIICLEDGKKLKMLKRHLKSAYNLTPDEYRQKWDLPPDYPMVAENYVLRRSSLAKSAGLGKMRGKSKRET